MSSSSHERKELPRAVRNILAKVLICCDTCKKAGIPRGDWLAHVLNECPIECPGCRAQITRVSGAQHDTICPDLVIDCTAADIGCPFQRARRLMVQHEAECMALKLAPILRQLQEEAQQLQSDVAHLTTLLGRLDPSFVRQSWDGAVVILPAASATLHGKTVRLLADGALGYWSDAEEVSWIVQFRRRGLYTVVATNACNRKAAGGTPKLILSMGYGGEFLEADVADTGSWSNYVRQTLGVIAVDPGIVEVRIGPSPFRILKFLMNLRSLEFSLND